MFKTQHKRTQELAGALTPSLLAFLNRKDDEESLRGSKRNERSLLLIIGLFFLLVYRERWVLGLIILLSAPRRTAAAPLWSLIEKQQKRQ